jgi:hypothetical protein
MAVALAFARSGGTEEAGKLADQVSAERPEDTLVQHYFIPTIGAAMKVQQHDPAAAIELLRGTVKYDRAFTGLRDYVYPAYIRGGAYLELGDGRSAAAQFTVRHVIGPLAWLELGRAQRMMGDEAASRKSHELSWVCGRTPIPTFRSISKPKPSTPGSRKTESYQTESFSRLPRSLLWSITI